MSNKMKREDKKIATMLKDIDSKLLKLQPYYEIVIEAFDEIEKANKGVPQQMTATIRNNSRSSSRRNSRRSSV